MSYLLTLNPALSVKIIANQQRISQPEINRSEENLQQFHCYKKFHYYIKIGAIWIKYFEILNILRAYILITIPTVYLENTINLDEK